MEGYEKTDKSCPYDAGMLMTAKYVLKWIVDECDNLPNNLYIQTVFDIIDNKLMNHVAENAKKQLEAQGNDKVVVKKRRMTNRELSRWLRLKPEEMREKGIYNADSESYTVHSSHWYESWEENEEVGERIKIRTNFGDWFEPTIVEHCVFGGQKV